MNNLVDDEQVILVIGSIMIGLTGFLFCINMLVIIVISVKAIAWKCYLKKAKKKRLEEYKEQSLQKFRDQNRLEDEAEEKKKADQQSRNTEVKVKKTNKSARQ